MTSRPDFSPAMLRFFLRAQVADALHGLRGGARRDARMKAVRGRMRKLARVTHAQMEMAWMGRLGSAEPRARLWAVLGHFPADHGLMLTDAGGQEAVNGGI